MYTESLENITFNDSQRFAKHLVDTIAQYQTNAHVSILDFGGGDGSIAYAAAIQLLQRGRKAVNITIVDYDEKIIVSQDSRISIKKSSIFEEIDPTLRYDLIIASAIIEHLSKPQKQLAGLLSYLDKGGIFYARTPYVLPLMNITTLFRIKWDFTYPAHLHDLGQDFWETYFKKKISNGNYQVLKSKPSIVETTIGKHFLRTIAAYCLKAPWHLLGQRYKWVGGWEVFILNKP